jgi:pimeloyl-ACP methyl ester carboxylesterase
VNYTNIFYTLKRLFNTHDAEIAVPGSDIVFRNYPFRSESLPAESPVPDARIDRKIYSALLNYYLRMNTFSHQSVFRSLGEHDANVCENKAFTYTIAMKKTAVPADKCILLLHGLNERNWDKYLPWAYELVCNTGKPVVMFPLAFHMNRAPALWSDPRFMNEVSKERMRLFPDVQCSSFANAALSIRLQFSPNRFLLSGIQTFNDIVQILDEIRTGRHPCIDARATVDLFGYSIGAFLAEIIVLNDPGNHFSDSRMFLFCGGPTLDCMSPVSRAIIDSEAAQSLRDYYVGSSDDGFLRNDLIRSALDRTGDGGRAFRSMLDHRKLRAFRTTSLKRIADRFMIVALRNDSVMRPEAIAASLASACRNRLHVADPPYRYSHENPFPPQPIADSPVDAAFRGLFDTAGVFLS